MKKLLIVLLNLFFSINMLIAQELDLGTDAQREAGKVLYNKKCAQCHGVNGDGQGVAANRFKPLPRDFTSAQFKFRTTASGELPTDSDIKKIIRNGMPYTGMPAWPDFTNEEIENLVYHIKSFSEDFADPDYIPKQIEFPEAPSYSEESAKKGRAVFETNECIKCHGNLGRGDGPSAPTLNDDKGNNIKPADLTKRWAFRGGGSREEIYRTFNTGVNGTPMPSYQGLIPEEKQWQLVDYVYSLSENAPNYGILIIAKAVQGDLDIKNDSTLFEISAETNFPIVGQVIEPGREFFPGVNAIKVSSVFNNEEIAIRLRWHDMSAERTGENGPDMEVAEEEEEESDDFWGDDFGTEEEVRVEFSDAVAIQFPAKLPEGNSKPYFLFGDSRNAVNLWYANLADSQAVLYSARGSKTIVREENNGLEVVSNYEDGQWTITFKQKRNRDNGKLLFKEGIFMPIAFSVWDGFNQERGVKRGISSWYNLYLEPQQKVSVIGPMFKWGFLISILELGLIFGVRRKYKKAK